MVNPLQHMLLNKDTPLNKVMPLNKGMPLNRILINSMDSSLGMHLDTIHSKVVIDNNNLMGSLDMDNRCSINQVKLDL